MRRFQEHKCKGNCRVSLINLAIKNYGVENFSFEELYYGEDYNLKERDYIRQYSSTNNEFGYNILEGGNSFGENCNASKLTDIQVIEIIQLLKNTQLTQNDIAEKFDISESTICQINNGKVWIQEEINYPIRQYFLTIEEINEIIDLIQNSTLTFKEISNDINIDIQIVYRINYGKSYQKDNIEYPLRNFKIGQQLADDIYHTIKTTDLKFQDIADIYQVSYITVNQINKGLIYRVNGNNYPARIGQTNYKTDECIDKIIHLLKTSKKSQKEIASEVNVSYGLIQKINKGELHTRNNEKYPIRIRDKKWNEATQSYIKL